MFSQVRIAVEAYGGAIHLISREKWWRFAYIPLLLKLLAVLLLFAIALSIHDVIYQWLTTLFLNSDWPWLQEVASSLNHPDSLFSIVLSWVIHVFLWMISMKLNKYVLLILLAPFLAWMAEKSENSMGCSRRSATWSTWLKNAWRGTLISMLYALLEFGCVMLFFVLALFPVFGGLLSPALIILGVIVSCYFCGATFLDYGCERLGWSIRKSIRANLRWKYAAISLGAIYSLCVILLEMIPIIGTWLAVAFVPMVSVVAGVILFQKLNGNPITRNMNSI